MPWPGPKPVKKARIEHRRQRICPLPKSCFLIYQIRNNHNIVYSNGCTSAPVRCQLFSNLDVFHLDEPTSTETEDYVRWRYEGEHD